MYFKKMVAKLKIYLGVWLLLMLVLVIEQAYRPTMAMQPLPSHELITKLAIITVNLPTESVLALIEPIFADDAEEDTSAQPALTSYQDSI